MKQSGGTHTLDGTAAMIFAENIPVLYIITNNCGDRNPAGDENFRALPHRPWDSPILL
jgi:hypothetical protein